MINKVMSKIREHLSEGLIALAIVGFASCPIHTYLTQYKLEKTPYIAKGCNQIGTVYYGYDDNNEGSVDRIEETGIVPSSRAINVPIKRTHLEGQLDFDFYLSQMNIKKYRNRYGKTEMFK